MEESGRRNVEPMERPMSGTPNLTTISTKLDRIATLAKQMPDSALKTLAHHIDIPFMREAYRLTRKNGAPGVDGQTAAEYEQDLEGNLERLIGLAKTGNYRAPPVRRVHIPKDNGSTRPIGIPTLEDKVLQRSVVMLLEPIYEHDFMDCSYGFRPGRSAHQALDRLWQTMMEMRGGWVLEVDIEKFFDTLDRSHLRNFVEQRVRDGVVLRLIGKWLRAGVLEHGELQHPEQGTPQGGVISPLLANIYLHEVLDKWFATAAKPRLKGRAELVRYADDFVMVFALEEDARRMWNALEKRLGNYGLKLHPDKTRLIPFNRPPREWSNTKKTVGTFDFLGFTHYWGKSRKNNWVIKQKTASSRLVRAGKRIAEWCRQHRHLKVRVQWKALCQKLRGHYAYYDLVANLDAVSRFRTMTVRTWRKWLSRRSQRAYISWVRMNQILEHYPLPWPRRRLLT